MKHTLSSMRAQTMLLLILCSSLKPGVQSYSSIHRSSKLQQFTSSNRKWGKSTQLGVASDLEVEQSDAVEALEKLLKKQRADVRETELLLNRISSRSALLQNDTAATANITDDFEDEFLSSAKSPGVASSILSGVDYGFISRSEGALFQNIKGGLPVDGLDGNSPAFKDYGPPANFVNLGIRAFKRNLDAIQGKYENEKNKRKLTKQQEDLQNKLKQLTLNVTAVWEREHQEQIEAPLVIKIPYYGLCYFLDFVFEGRYVPSRFYFLETVARMPYFSYIAMLHLYETLGWWRRSSDVKRIHFAEEWNEFNHLLIMESLGGDQEWWVRFLAYHSAILYYVALTILWALSPTLAYKFSELLETHAVNTYGQMLDENEDLLKSMSPSRAAVQYYAFGSTDPLFDEYQTTAMAQGSEPRRPGNDMRSLYDVFSAIRDDEGDHVGTMKACLDPNVVVKSPSVEKTALVSIALIAAFGYFISTGDLGGLDINGLDGAADGLVDAELVDAALTGAAAGAGRELLSEENAENLLEFLEGGAVIEQVRRVINLLFETIMKIISKL